MSDIRKELHHEDGLEIVLLVEDGEARVEIRGGVDFDLAAMDDVVVVVNGQAMAIDVQSADFAFSKIGPWEAYAHPISLMIRVHEFFEGWELDG